MKIQELNGRIVLAMRRSRTKVMFPLKYKKDAQEKKVANGALSSLELRQNVQSNMSLHYYLKKDCVN